MALGQKLPMNGCSGVARGRATGQLPPIEKVLPEHFFEMLPIAQYRCIDGRVIRLGKARASYELEDWMLEEAGTCPELKN